jgi:hypothetical protein
VERGAWCVVRGSVKALKPLNAWVWFERKHNIRVCNVVNF